MSARSLIIGLAPLLGLFAVPWSVSAAGSDLVVSLQGPAEAARGQTVQHEVTVANNGPDAAPQVRMTSSTSYDFIFEPNFSDGRCNAPYGSVSCDLGLLPAGTVTNLTLAFTVRPLSSASSCSAQMVTHTASLSFSGTDPLFGNNSASVQTSLPCPPPTECNDGIDNDRDGAIDYSAYSWNNGDFGCLSANDRDERYPESVCQDGRDNDGDGLIDFPWDPGCASRQDNDEFNLPPPSPPVSPPPSLPLYSPPPLLPPSSNSPPLPATLLPQGSTPWLALPIPRCYNNVGPDYVEDILIDLRCEGSKWGSGSGGGSGGGGSGNGGGSGGGSTGGFGGGGGAAVCTGNERAAIERTSDQREVLPGSLVRYTVVVRNTSLRCPFLNLILRRLPPGTVVIDAGGGLFDGHALRWNIPRIEPGATHRISYSVRVPRSFSGDRFGGELSIDGTDGQIR
ncbi:DUF11 domain-containing protein, partial [Candidatus Peregrinibacteria bacterium]|nr:DUF11 domain-containing protein [Candidatus Peregrinibacteria bacterium]